jgi:uncharacterized alpha-E superfamily protein
MRHGCHDTADSIQARLKAGTIKQIFDTGLHEFLGAFLHDNNRLGEEVARDYRFY